MKEQLERLLRKWEAELPKVNQKMVEADKRLDTYSYAFYRGQKVKIKKSIREVNQIIATL